MKATCTLVATLLLFVPAVIGHGYVSLLAVDGTSSFKGDEPTEDGQSTQPSAIRRISKIDPVKGASNPFLNCGQNATAAALVAPTNAGDSLTFQWEAGGGEGWPHNMGPLMFYLANCGDTTCDQFDSTTAQWFKISQIGLMSDEETWYQQNLMDGGPANVTIPSNIAPGNYIIRHEIIALHLGNEMGGAEFYPSCSQLNISGSGTGAPTSSELVSLPGAYSDTDPGIYVPDIFNGPMSNYTFPGPAIAAFISGSTSTTSAAGSPSSTGAKSSTTAKSAGTSKGAGSTKTSSSAPTSTGIPSTENAATKCRLVKQPGPLARRHFTQVMRRLLGFESH